MQEERREVRINRKVATRRLAVDFSTDPQQFRGELRLLPKTPDMLDGRIRECQIDGAISEWQTTTVTQHVRQVAMVVRNPNIDDEHPFLPADHIPDGIVAANICYYLTRAVTLAKIAKTSAAKKTPHRSQKIIRICPPTLHQSADRPRINSPSLLLTTLNIKKSPGSLRQHQRRLVTARAATSLLYRTHLRCRCREMFSVKYGSGCQKAQMNPEKGQNRAIGKLKGHAVEQ